MGRLIERDPGGAQALAVSGAAPRRPLLTLADLNMTE
jgi:hypothetical protein